MDKLSENQSRRKWKEHLLKSGVPLEYEVARILALQDFTPSADFSFLRRDVAGSKEWSVDLSATWFGPTPTHVKFCFDFLVECKYRSPDKTILFMEVPADGQYSPVTLGGTTECIDAFVPYHLSSQFFEEMEDRFKFVYKGIEVHEGGAFETEFQHGIQQLRYATPALLRQTIDFNISVHDEDILAIFFAKILVTNAPLRVFHASKGIEEIKAAEKIEDVSDAVECVILHSDYGPDYEDHFRSVFEIGADHRLKNVTGISARLRKSRKKFRWGREPKEYVEDVSSGRRYETHRISTQFFVTTLGHLPKLIRALKLSCIRSYRARSK